ncbi:MAG: hypothetical protein IJ551_02330 [Prevotella sp.]|nr:hypothetical protein [Prevotella sp.]
MAKTNTSQPEKESVVTDKLHKSSGSAVLDVKDYNRQLAPDEDKEWLVAILEHQKYTVSCCEYIEKEFQEQGCTCYVPSKQEEHRYANRTRRTVTRLIIPRFIFVSGISENQAYRFVRDWPHVEMFMPDRASKRRGGHIALARIAHGDMLKLQNAINGIKSADDIAFTTENLAFDEQIKVVSGELEGLEGGYYYTENNHFLVFTLGKLGNIKVRVSIDDCTLKK